jgi:hypothetical protein
MMGVEPLMNFVDTIGHYQDRPFGSLRKKVSERPIQ